MLSFAHVWTWFSVGDLSWLLENRSMGVLISQKTFSEQPKLCTVFVISLHVCCIFIGSMCLQDSLLIQCGGWDLDGNGVDPPDTILCTCLLGTSGWVGQLFSSGEGGRHPMSEDEKRQLCQSHGWRWQWRLWWESQTLSQDPGTSGQLPKSHTAITDWDDHSTVRKKL